MSAFGIIEPHFSEETNCTTTVTPARYRAVLGILVMDADCIDSELRFQQNGVILHTAREPIDCARAMIPDPSFHILVTSYGKPGLLTFLYMTTFSGNI